MELFDVTDEMAEKIAAGGERDHYLELKLKNDVSRKFTFFKKKMFYFYFLFKDDDILLIEPISKKSDHLPAPTDPLGQKRIMDQQQVRTILNFFAVIIY